MLKLEGEYSAMLERVNAMPGQGVASMFSMGDSFGVIRCALAAASIPTEYITPQSWKKHFHLDSNKEAARALAIRLYPMVDLHLKKFIDRAEALLIATYLKDTREGVKR
jgi:crossover junction endodeoxyribonuclease RuvC